MKLKYGLEYDPKGSQHQFNKGMAERKDIAERILEGLKDLPVSMNPYLSVISLNHLALQVRTETTPSN